MDWNIRNEADVEEAVTSLWTLIVMRTLESVVETIPTDLADLPGVRFLHAVLRYRLEYQKESAERKWMEIYYLFQTILDTKVESAVIRFYLHNYCLRAGGNAKLDRTTIEHHFISARTAWLGTPKVLHPHLQSILYFDYSTWILHTDVTAAETTYISGARRAEEWFTHIREAGVDQEDLIAAATMLWRMYDGVTHFFPNQNPGFLRIDTTAITQATQLADKAFTTRK